MPDIYTEVSEAKREVRRGINFLDLVIHYTNIYWSTFCVSGTVQGSRASLMGVVGSLQCLLVVVLTSQVNSRYSPPRYSNDPGLNSECKAGEPTCARTTALGIVPVRWTLSVLLLLDGASQERWGWAETFSKDSVGDSPSLNQFHLHLHFSHCQ